MESRNKNKSIKIKTISKNFFLPNIITFLGEDEDKERNDKQ